MPCPPSWSWHQQLEARCWPYWRSLNALKSLSFCSCVAHIIVSWDTACCKAFSSYITAVVFHWFCKEENLQNIRRELQVIKRKFIRTPFLEFLRRCADRSLVNARPLYPFDHANNQISDLPPGNSFSSGSRIPLNQGEVLINLDELGCCNPCLVQRTIEKWVIVGSFTLMKNISSCWWKRRSLFLWPPFLLSAC